MKLLVTGGAGFIGSAVVRHFVAAGDEVVNVDKLTYAGRPENLEPIAGRNNYSFHEMDICDRVAVRELALDVRPDAIIHLAAESHVDRSIDGPRTFIETNILGTFELLEVARELTDGNRDFRFVHVSTDEVFGALGDTGLFSETSPYQPRSPYSASKASADHLARAWFETYQLPVMVTNCANNYGPYQFPEKLIPITILNAMAGRPVRIYGDGLQVRDWLHVDDHVQGLARVLERGRLGESYNFGGMCEKANKDLVATVLDCLARHIDVDPEVLFGLIEYVEDRPGHDRRYAVDSTKVQRELDWEPAHTFEQGIDATVRWYRDNTAWCEAVSETYRGQRLGRV